MKALFLLLVGLWPLALLGATGDIKSVRTDGWSAYVCFEGLSSGGTYAYGLGTGRTISGGEKLVLTVTSSGYDNSGNTRSFTRTVYGTKVVRAAGTTNPDENAVTGFVTNRIALSDFIYSGETATANVGSGFYTQGTANNAATGLTVNNDSALTYPRVIGNWTWPGFNCVTNTMVLRCVAFHCSAENGLPVAAVTFTATDQHAHTVTVTTNKWTVDWSVPDAQHFGEVIGVLDVSGMTQGDVITCNFKAYPWMGDAGAVLDTSATTAVFPTADPAPLTNVCDNGGSYGCVRAIVDASAGNDSTGLAANNPSWSLSQTPNPFLTIGGAIKAITGTNSASYSRASIENSYVLLKAGTYAWMGATVSGITLGNTSWCHIAPAAGVAQSSVIIGSQSGTQRLVNNVDKYHVYNLTISGSTAGGLWYVENVWQDQCNAQWTGAAYFQTSTAANLWWITDGVVSNLTQGIISPGSQKLLPALVRGVDLTDFGKKADLYTFVGNNKRATDFGATANFVFDQASQAWPTSYWGVVYNNRLKGSSVTGNIFQAPTASFQSNGVAIVQNVFEMGTNSSSTGGTFDLGSNNAYEYTNFMYWNNGFYFTKSFVGYNDTGTAAAYRYLWSLYNNVFSDYNTKGDLFTGGSGLNAARIGNWPIAWGVQFFGNIDLATTGIGAPSSFENEDPTISSGFEGLNCTPYYVDYSATSATNWPGFVTPANYVKDTPLANLTTDYHLQTSSPLLTRQASKWVLPYDIEGVYRGAFDPPGPYASANPKKGAGFFGQ